MDGMATKLMAAPDDLVTIAEAARMAGVSRQTMYNHMRSGRIKPVKKDNASMLRLSDVKRFISAIIRVEAGPFDVVLIERKERDIV
jgi:predicted site-specific integrase-resolvase